MRDQGLVARPRRRFKATTDSTHADPIAPNLLKRDFTASCPDQVWVGDVTAIATLEGWLFLAVLIDLHSRRVVGWSTSVANDRHLALDALAKARQDRRPGPGIIVHSDRGSPYASDDYRKALAAMGARPSMSRSGDCWDNAVAESFFSSAKTELAIRRPLASFRVAEALLADYINHFYNPVRLHSTVGYMSPVAYELRSRATALAA
jgi:transposase InsO family protein